MRLRIKAEVANHIVTIEQNSKGGWYIRKEENGAVYLLDPVDGWIPLSAFIHSADWKGCVFTTKELAEKALDLHRQRLRSLVR